MRYSARASILIFITLLSISSIPHASAEPMSINATVPANATNFSQSLSSDTSPSSTLGQNQTTTYTIAYNSLLPTATEVTVEATWTRGTIQGNSYPSTDVVSYVPGSATEAIGTVQPIVDLVNKKISWTFTLPANTSGIVSFKLKTSSTLTTTLPTTFRVSSFLLGPGFITNESSLMYNYLVPPPGTPPSPTPAPPGATTPTGQSVIITPSPAPLIALPPISTLVIQEINPTSASIVVTLTKPGSITLLYGTSANTLTNTIYDSLIVPTHQLSLSNLLPNTVYYIRILTTLPGGTTASEIYSFRTGKKESGALPTISSLIVASNNTILTNPLQLNTASLAAQVIIPKESPYEFRIAVTNSQSIVQIQAYLRSTILGLRLPSIRRTEEVNDIAVDLTEISNGNFIGKLMTPPQIGRYELVVKIYDTNGNISEKKIAIFTVSQKFILKDQITRKPVENARVALSVWNLRTNRYEELRPGTFSVASPLFSTPDGVVPVILPAGKYKAEVSQIQYQSKTIEFEIKDSGRYPEILLTPTEFNIPGFILSLRSGLFDVFFQTTGEYLQNLSASRRVLELVNSTTLVCISILFLLSLRTRLQLSLIKLPRYLHLFLKHGFKRHDLTGKLSGRLIDSQTDQPISSAAIYLLDVATHVIQEYAITNSQGYFKMQGVIPKEYRIEMRRLGYHPLDLEKMITEEDTELSVALSPKHHAEGVLPYLIHSVEQFTQSIFEVLLFFLVILILLNTLATPSLTSFIFLVIGLLNVRIFLTYKNRQVRDA